MKIALAIAAISLLLVLLTWLSLRSIDLDAERFDQALGEMDRFELLEAELRRDVLSARAGALRNYDHLAHEAAALNGSVDHLRQATAFDASVKSLIDHLAAMVLHQERLVEQFKSNNALLQNSLAYFGLFGDEESGPLVPFVSSLGAAMLRFTLDTSPPAASEVQVRLEALTQRWLELTNRSFAGETLPMEALLGHAQLLHDLLPETDEVLKTILSVPQVGEQTALRAMMQAQRSASRHTAREFRAFLYVTSLLLVGLLVYVGLQLHARSRVLRRKALFENVLAGISMSLVTAREQDFDATLENALAQMARCLGAGRAYVVLADLQSTRVHTWHSDPVLFGPGWPDQAFTAADQLGSTMDGVVHVTSVNRMPSGVTKNILAVCGLRGWACVVRHAMPDTRILLGFDTVTRLDRVMLTAELGLLRMAMDAITNALSRQASDRERTRLELRLQQARRLEAVGTLASGVAHNFNNIIGAILGYVEMAHGPQLAPEALDGIQQAGERARDLVDQILNFARPRELVRQSVNVRPLMAQTMSLLRASHPPTVQLLFREASEDLVICVAAAPLQQVILNLCNNAAQAMNGSGHIDLDVEATDVATALPLSHSVLPPGSYVRISVSDSGHGIDAAMLKQIFEPFFTTRIAGNGLGLATALHIVKEHGGAINVTSTVGVGSRFEVWLPRIVREKAESPVSSATLPLGRGETVLIVEDDPGRLLGDEEALAALGYEPVGCTNAMVAQEMCYEPPERFDAVIVGHLSPLMAALELAGTLHEIAPRRPILLAAATADDLDARALIASGVADVVHWPIMISEIAEVLHACLQRNAPRKVSTQDETIGNSQMEANGIRAMASAVGLADDRHQPG
jgi:signal transduction histidine kinase/DNA-binding NarL/FixJ family response regulator